MGLPDGSEPARRLSLEYQSRRPESESILGLTGRLAQQRQALREADPKALVRWVELILPALKGEPYAQARSIAESRLNEPELPRPVAQRVAELLGVKLRATPAERK